MNEEHLRRASLARRSLKRCEVSLDLGSPPSILSNSSSQVVSPPCLSPEPGSSVTITGYQKQKRTQSVEPLVHPRLTSDELARANVRKSNKPSVRKSLEVWVSPGDRARVHPAPNPNGLHRGSLQIVPRPFRVTPDTPSPQSSIHNYRNSDKAPTAASTATALHYLSDFYGEPAPAPASPHQTPKIAGSSSILTAPRSPLLTVTECSEVTGDSPTSEGDKDRSMYDSQDLGARTAPATRASTFQKHSSRFFAEVNEAHESREAREGANSHHSRNHRTPSPLQLDNAIRKSLSMTQLPSERTSGGHKLSGKQVGTSDSYRVHGTRHGPERKASKIAPSDLSTEPVNYSIRPTNMVVKTSVREASEQRAASPSQVKVEAEKKRRWSRTLCFCFSKPQVEC